MANIGSQLDSDRRLLKYRNYEEYLDSLVTPVDFCYLRNTRTARQLAELGYRSGGETFDKDSFQKRLTAIKNILFPIYRPYVLTSEFVEPYDELMQALALRERSNRLNITSTIIFIRTFIQLHYEVSGYIDYSERITKENWLPLFQGKKKLWPRTTDLTYYHWRSGKAHLNKTANYIPIIHRTQGLLFKHITDRKMITVDPAAPSPGIDTTRTRLHSKGYVHIILFDHVVRSKV